jgi:hypothetical protein
VEAEAIVNALIESDETDPKEFLSQQTCENLLSQNGFKPHEGHADTFYRYFPTQFDPGEATALAAIITLHYSDFEGTKVVTTVHLKSMFVKQPPGWEAGLPVGRSFVWIGGGGSEMDSANKLASALHVISAAATWDNQRRSNAALRSGLAKLGQIVNQ